MRYMTRRWTYAGAAAAALTAAGAIAWRRTARAQSGAEPAVAPSAPPPRRLEAVPQISAERQEREFWQPGEWRWNGRAHVWQEGRYIVRPRPGAIWFPGFWERRGDGHLYVEGHWS